jgi:predicted HTH domain antitoxin
MKMETQTLEGFDDILAPLGAQSAQFFLAASLYHAKKVSFHRAAQLAGLSFEEFKARLKEHFSTGYILADEAAMDDIQTVDTLLSE